MDTLYVCDLFYEDTIKTKVLTGLKLCRLRSNFNVSFRHKGTKIEMYNPTIHTYYIFSHHKTK